MCKAMDIAKWFIKNGYEAPNSFDGNMKLNKLLYFAQLISLVKRDKALFKDELYAFEHGMVVENIRKEYCNNYNDFIDESVKFDENFLDDEKNILVITKDIFGEINAEELSELTHQHDCWNDYYNKSKINNWHSKTDSIVKIETIINDYQGDLDLIRNILSAYEENTIDNEEKYIEVDKAKFYYNPIELKITDDILEKVKNFPIDDLAYSMYLDESQGLVIY